MAAVSSTVTVTTAATSLGAAQKAAVITTVYVPVGGQVVFVGGPGVTTATGVGIAVGTARDFLAGPGEQLFAIVAATTQAVGILNLGV